MSEKFEKCPNCDEKLSGMFSKDIVKDEVIKEINEKIKKIKDELEDVEKGLEEKEAYCTKCFEEFQEYIGKYDPALEEKRLSLEEKRLRIETDPKCPSCGIVGMDYIKEFGNIGTKRGGERGDPWFEIVACIKCGHVYGTLGGQ